MGLVFVLVLAGVSWLPVCWIPQPEWYLYYGVSCAEVRGPVTLSVPVWKFKEVFLDTSLLTL